MNNIKIVLAERTYTVKPLPIKPARAFREGLGAEFEKIVGSLKMDTSLLSDPQRLTELVGNLRGTIINSPDLALRIICDYSPEIAADKEYIEENGFDDEVITALVEVVKLLYPFGVLKSMMSGLPKTPTLRK
jgi:hypothetical protein